MQTDKLNQINYSLSDIHDGYKLSFTDYKLTWFIKEVGQEDVLYSFPFISPFTGTTEVVLSNSSKVLLTCSYNPVEMGYDISLKLLNGDFPEDVKFIVSGPEQIDSEEYVSRDVVPKLKNKTLTFTTNGWTTYTEKYEVEE